MKYFILFAKTLMAVIWVLLITNLFVPFPGKAAITFYFLLAFITVMHAIQVLIVYGAFGEKLKLTKKEGFELFFFGIFKMLQIKSRLL